MIDEYIDKIIQNPLFLNLKNIIENNPYHDHESVYDHLIKTKDLSLQNINGNFITNSDAKKMFLKFVNGDFHGTARVDLIIVAALLHDVGKLETSQVIDSNNMITFPGHEEKGGDIAGKLLEGIFNKEQINYISRIIGTHGFFQGEYLPSKTDWTIQDIVDDMKNKPDGLYIESMFNNFCDVYNSLPFQPYKELVIKIFSEPKLYVS